MYPDCPSCYFREPAFSLVYKVALSHTSCRRFHEGEERRKPRSGFMWYLDWSKQANPPSCVARQVELKLPACIYTGPVFVLREADNDSVTTDRLKHEH